MGETENRIAIVYEKDNRIPSREWPFFLGGLRPHKTESGFVYENYSSQDEQAS